MKKLLKILIGILVAALILFIAVNFIAPKKMQMEVTQTIDAPANLTYNLVNNLKSWEDWSPWAKLDTNAINTYSDKTSGVGAYWTWKGNKEVGEGKQTIKESVLGEKIKMALEFNGWDGVSYSDWKFEKTDNNKTKISWGFDGAETAFPMRFFNLFMKGPLTKSYKEGLGNLKTLAEKRAKEKVYRGYKINEITIPEKHYVLNRSEVKVENIQQFYMQNLGNLFVKIQKAGAEMDGMPSGLFFKWDEKNGVTDMAASIPTKTAVNIKGAETLTIPEKRALQINYFGEYDKTSNAHYAIDEYMKDYDLLNDAPIIEEYVTDPVEEKDPSKWLTKITYYLAGN